MDKTNDKKTVYTCKYETCNSYPNEDVDFNYLNISYPIDHNHDCWEILIVTKGKIMHNINGQSRVMQTGSSLLIRPDDVHSIHIYDESINTHHLSINIKSDYMRKILSAYSDDLYDKVLALPSLPVINLSELEINKIISTIMNITTNGIEVGTRVFELKIITDRILNVVLENVFASSQNVPDWFTSFLFKLSDPFIDSSKVEELTKYTPYSYSHLAPLFKKLTGKTIIEYIMECKIKGAQDLLKTTDMSISEIATKLNYESFSYFNRIFKRYSKISPSEYRKKYKL